MNRITICVHGSSYHLPVFIFLLRWFGKTFGTTFDGGLIRRFRVANPESDGSHPITVLVNVLCNFILSREGTGQNNIDVALLENIRNLVSTARFQPAIADDVETKAVVIVVARLQSVTDVKLHVIETIDRDLVNGGALSRTRYSLFYHGQNLAQGDSYLIVR